MPSTQESTTTQNKPLIDYVPKPYSELTNIQRAYVDYKAVSGLVTTDDGIRKMPVDELAKMFGVTRYAFYKAKDALPNFWDLVSDRRKEIGSQERLTKMHEVWYLKAMGSGPQAFNYFQLWQANFNPNFRMPAQKVEHEMGNSWAALLQGKEKPKQIENNAQPTD